MTNKEFRLWIQGYCELSQKLTLDRKQAHIVQNHANLVKATVGTLDEDIQLFINECNQQIRTGLQEISLANCIQLEKIFSNIIL